MSTNLFVATLTLAVFLPVMAVSYLKPILVKVLRGFCDADGGAEFWIRSAYLLAVCGTLLLTLTFGRFDEVAHPTEILRRSLWLVFAGVFATVAFIASNVWSQVRRVLETPARGVATKPTGSAS